MTLDEEQPTGSKPTVTEGPSIHRVMEAPLCQQCQRLQLSFFDPHCPGCHKILVDPNTEIAEIFAIIRQWVPQVQQNIHLFGEQILQRGAHVDDRDGLTDMTLLQYTCKSAAAGVGDVANSVRFCTLLLSKGADIGIRCHWTHMTSLHYAVYFDVIPIILLLLKASNTKDIDSRCREYDNGTCLHLAASNSCYEAAKCLLQHGANATLKDELGRTPIECIPDPDSLSDNKELAGNALRLIHLLQSDSEFSIPKYTLPSYESVPSKVLLASLGLNIGDKVTIGGSKIGVLRYCGTTQFAPGIWAGIEMEGPEGKNDGSVGGIAYFSCPPKHGVFAPMSKVSKPGTSSKPSTPRFNVGNINYAKVDVSRVASKIDTGRKNRSPSITSSCADEMDVGERVIVAGQRVGVVRFCGETMFAPGVWYGIELDKALGKNDGTVSGQRYFNCKPKHGVFAPPSRVTRMNGSLAGSVESLPYAASDMNSTFPALGLRKIASSQMSTSMKSLSTSKSRSRQASLEKQQSFTNDDFKLTVGLSVYVNNEIGVIRFIGPTDFAEGVWLGVELKTPSGKNDGSVQGKRYFTCKKNHGLLVRPSRVSVRGIKGDQLL
ncbi:CAP-Gly domain-containing linker protein 3-like isoform X2 [Anneissia japonica]|uniref:CAP-Gly domain-containing linker protein 3-like isoform X2 n=1 Tax=Anneissia japonica TaxID=1529436 RepID=UPI0014255023|nr:CAP-Gly domain-containing linker protein 3-like isoform X2 [Anneissia japonica]